MRHVICRLSLSSALLFGAGAAHSEDLVVAPGATRTIVASEQYMVLNRLVLGNGATINFAPDVDHWEVWAERADFGEGALIDARGASGPNGGNGARGKSTNTPGKYGTPGGPGIHGTDGRRGVDLAFRIRIANFGGVLVDASGGFAGAGGNGGAGGKSGDARCSDRKKARNGERGGRAGDGGDGGNGATIDFKYTSAENGFSEGHEDEIRELMLPGINFVSDGGSGNVAGQPGKGGAGGHGNSACIPKLGGGKRGSKGGKGTDGVVGEPGAITIVKDDFGGAIWPNPDNKKQEFPKYYDETRYP